MDRPAIPEDFAEIKDQEIIDLLKGKAHGQPIALVNFFEAQKLCAALGGRLPTEEEWLESFSKKPYFGGILEWVDSWFDSKLPVVRGGSWDFDFPGNLSCGFRCYVPPAFRYDNFGFRCVWVGESAE